MQLNGLNVSIICGNPPEKMEEYPYAPQDATHGVPVKDTNNAECWIASTSGTKFSISWGSANALNSKRISHVLACSVFVDGVFTERGLLPREDFERGDQGKMSGYSLDAYFELPFCFEERDPMDFTPTSYTTDEHNTITIELEWCRRHCEHTGERPLDDGLPSFSLGPISTPAGPDVHRDAVSLEELIAQNIIPNPKYVGIAGAIGGRPYLKRKRDRAPSPEEIKELTRPACKMKPCIKFDIHEDNKSLDIEHLEMPKEDKPALPLLTHEVDPWRLGC
ncbi:hypothetical protein BDV93DRAFT_553346 [Ceratobasidium sp. AG-I]|nr:hypothetical protein BDV93DRAFT_553346 [Ceratobasidium sp. AG-I]